MKKIRTLFKSPDILLFVILLCICLAMYLYQKVENDDRYIYEKISTTSYDDPNVDFTIYVDKFYRDLDVYGHYPRRPHKMIIKFADIDKIKDATNINAVSFGLGDDNIVEIYVNPSFWKSAKRAQKYWLMYHELSHDILNLKDLDASPINMGKLMYPQMSVFDVTDMDEFIEAYHDLFSSL